MHTGPLPYIDTAADNWPNGINLIVEFKLQGLENEGIFYTDSNGLGMIKREVASHRKPGSDAFKYKGSVG